MRYKPTPCQECGRPYQATRRDQNFCSPRCKVAYLNRSICRSRRVYEMLYHWRYDRANNTDQLRELCREVAQWIDEDKSQGRRPPPRFNPQRRGTVHVH